MDILITLFQGTFVIAIIGVIIYFIVKNDKKRETERKKEADRFAKLTPKQQKFELLEKEIAKEIVKMKDLIKQSDKTIV